jgi:hypothetical protein
MRIPGDFLGGEVQFAQANGNDLSGAGTITPAAHFHIKADDFRKIDAHKFPRDQTDLKFLFNRIAELTGHGTVD